MPRRVQPRSPPVSFVCGSIDSRFAIFSKSAPALICASTDSALTRATSLAAGVGCGAMTICLNVTVAGFFGRNSFAFSNSAEISASVTFTGTILPSCVSLRITRSRVSCRRNCSIRYLRYSSGVPSPAFCELGAELRLVRLKFARTSLTGVDLRRDVRVGDRDLEILRLLNEQLVLDHVVQDVVTPARASAALSFGSSTSRRWIFASIGFARDRSA